MLHLGLDRFDLRSWSGFFYTLHWFILNLNWSLERIIMEGELKKTKSSFVFERRLLHVKLFWGSCSVYIGPKLTLLILLLSEFSAFLSIFVFSPPFRPPLQLLRHSSASRGYFPQESDLAPRRASPCHVYVPCQI